MPKVAYTTGPKYPTSTTTTNGSGSSGQWDNPANIFADDGSNATSGFLAPPSTTQDLTGFGFGLNIPSKAVIDGIVVEMKVPSSNRWAENQSSIRLAKAGVAGGTNKAGTGSSSNNIWRYGSNTDLWGRTWTPAEINASNFGAVFWATYTSSGNDFTIAIDYIRITVYWHYSVDVSPADVPKRYLYKVFNQGQYLGNLPSVTSIFNYSHDINSVGASLNVECSTTADRSALPGSRIVTEGGDPITDESGNYLYTDGQPQIIGLGNNIDPLIIQNGNNIEVWQYDYYYPNGKLMYKGQVNRIEAGFGDSADAKIKLTLFSDGADLDNKIARGAPFSYTADVTQSTWSLPVWNTITQGVGGWNRYGQTWIAGAGVTKLGAIDLMLNGVADVTVTVFDGFNGTAIGSVTQRVDTSATSVVPVRFAFANLITIVPGNQYFFTVQVDVGQSMVIHYATGNPYASGDMYNSNYSGGSGGGAYFAVSGSDLYFITYSGLATTTATYTSKDPSTTMLKPIIDDYRARGGVINYDATSFDATGLSLTATFNTETILDAIKKCLSLAPNGFYFYVDLGSDILYFKNTLTTPTYKLIKGRHLNKVNLVMSIENVKK